MKEPSHDDWTGLHQAAIEFYRASPWEWIPSEDLFAIENPSDGEMGYCSILGSGREEFGLGVFLGDKGLNGYAQMMVGETEPEDFDDHIMVPLLTVLFVDRQELQNRDLRVIRSLGLRFRGRNAWPLFRSQRPGYAPWFLEKEEALFLTAAIQQALVVASEVRSDGLDLFDEESEESLLTRFWRGGEWREEWRAPQIRDEDSEGEDQAAEAVNEARLQLLHSRTRERSGSWELDIFMLPAPIGPPASRSYFPLCLLAVERESGLIVASRIGEPWRTLSERQDEVIQILEDAEQLPDEILVKSDKVQRVVKPIATRLGIGIRVEGLSMLEEVKGSLQDHLSGGAT